jgi:two-component system cell cycle sensor histidine kinase/response regulator CckA
MTIKTRLNLTIAVSLAVMLVISGWIGAELFRVTVVVRNNLEVNALTRQVILLHSLTYDYLDAPSSRAETQWRQTYETLNNLLQGIERDPKGLTRIPSHVITNYANINEIFNQIVVVARQLDLSDRGQRANLDGLETQLPTMLLRKNQELYDWVLSASAESNARLLSGVRRDSLYFVVLLVIISAGLAGILLTVKNVLLNSITRLRQGVETIRRGDLNHRIAPVGNDEFGGLSSAFNAMTADLQLLYQKLEDKNQALRDSEQRFRALVENATDGVAILRADRTVAYISPSIEQMLGYTPDELLKMDPFGLVHPDDLKLALSQFSRMLETREPVALTLRIRHRNNAWHDLELVGTNLLGQPAIAGVVLNFRDITGQKQAEELRRQAEEKYRSIFENATEGIFQSTPGGKLLTANPALARMLGCQSPEELVAAIQDIGRQVYAIPLQRDGLLRLLEERGVVTGFECEFVRKDQSRVWVSVSSKVVRGKDGSLLYYEGSVEDISERKRLESQLHQSQKMEAFGQLAGGVAHDFNNILTVIQANASLLQDGETLPAEREESVREILQATERAAGLTRQLLTFSRRQVMQPASLDLNEVVQNIGRMLRRIIGEDIDFVSRFAGGSVHVNADQGMLEQVLMNLAVNARDAMPKGGRLVVETGVVSDGLKVASPRARPGRYARLSVKDTGCGIALEHLPRIFEPFFTTKDIGRGTGLGLATVFGIVEQHGGWIDVESQVGTGTTFHIYLPRLDTAPAPVKRQPVAEAPGGRETILLVEDETSVRLLARDFLRRKGYQVYEAATGGDAEEIWRQHAGGIDLLLTDLVMPGGMNGRELAERLRAEKPDLKVIFCSGYSAAVLGDNYLPAGGERFLQKPFDPLRLAQFVRDCLDQRMPPAGRSS